jgi:lipopolysaccharide/colanic/teichoic acid biosynthesis glycosyltransferase
VTTAGGRDSLNAHRALDLVVTVLLLPFVLALGALIAAAIFVDSPGPIFYRSTRIGRGGRTFRMLKFRKMRRDAAGSSLTSLHDERFTPIGKFLAVTKLDELPQVWHVLKGDMRLIGPRPEVPEFVAAYRDQYEEILTIHPGITGLAQLEYVHESRLFTEPEDPAALYVGEILPRKIELDIGYVRTRSLPGDLWILVRTVLLPVRALMQRWRLLANVEPARAIVYLALLVSALLLVGAFAAVAGPVR